MRPPLLGHVVDLRAGAVAEDGVGRELGVRCVEPLTRHVHEVHAVDGLAAARGEGGAEHDDAVSAGRVDLGEHVAAQRRVAALDHERRHAQRTLGRPDVIQQRADQRRRPVLGHRARVRQHEHRVVVAQQPPQLLRVSFEQHGDAGDLLRPRRVVVEDDGDHPARRASAREVVLRRLDAGSRGAHEKCRPPLMS
jgi:hypothetical protein